MTYDLVLDALADPTRRTLLELLRMGERSVGELADELPVSQPAVSQHLRVLLGAGLVLRRSEGSRRLYALRPEGMEPLRSYLASFWDEVLDAYRRSWRDSSQPEV